MTHSPRFTIGVLAGWQAYEEATPNRFLENIFNGARAAAADLNCNLLLACGLGRAEGLGGKHTGWPVLSNETDFLPVGPWNTDGLLVIPPLWTDARWNYLSSLNEAGFPLVLLGHEGTGASVMVDNNIGIRQAVQHLAEHGHQRILFIAGEQTEHGDSAIRLKAYQEAVKTLGLIENPALVTYGYHTTVASYEAMKRVLRDGVTFSAVLASNDPSAIGAIQALHEHKIKVPQDVAVIGFDDQPQAVAQVPSLTTIRYPLYEAGYAMVELLLEQLHANALNTPEAPLTLPQKTQIVPTQLIIRQSCGCLFAKSSAPSSLRSEASTRKLVEHTVEEVITHLQTAFQHINAHELHRLCWLLAKGLHESVCQVDSTPFRNALIETVLALEIANEDVHPLQGTLTLLRTWILEQVEEPELQARAEELIHQARVAFSESATRRDKRQRLYENEQANYLNRLTARLLSTLQEEEMLYVLEDSIGTLKVKQANVILFGGEQTPELPWCTLSQRDAASLKFPAADFPPPQLYSKDVPFSLALVPLVFQDEQLGFVSYDATNLEPLAAITRQLAVAFKNVKLHSEVLELSLKDGLTGLYNRRYLDLFLKNEMERAQRFERDLAVIMIDIDHFKSYNDTYGHPAGDEAIRQVAQCVAQDRRSVDLVARYGGEELALVLPETHLEGAVKVAQDICLNVSKLSALKRHITASLGVAALGGRTMTPEKLIGEADQGLYIAKRTGRNKVGLAAEPVA
jgi:diguanylate cyclase (GGDEF)-like protein